MKPIRSVEHAANSLRKRGYIVKRHDVYDPVLDYVMSGFVVVPDDGTVWDFASLPHYYGLQLIDIAEKKRTEDYVEKPPKDPNLPDHYDLLFALTKNAIGVNEVLRDMRAEIADLKERLLG